MGLVNLVKNIVKTPIAIIADITTLGGTLSDRDEPYTKSVISKILDDVVDIIEY
jgi:hypothetical protein